MKHTPTSFVPEGTLIGGLTAAQRVPIIAAEEKTHRHLDPDEAVQNGDVYGGDDWKFLYTIGGKHTQIKPGTLAKSVGMGYRPRRPL